MLARSIRDIKTMLLFWRKDFPYWLSSFKTFSNWYRLIAYRIAFLFKQDFSMVFTLHARNGIRFRAGMEDFGSVFGCWLSREYFPNRSYTLPDGATVVDIGASIGLFTLYIAGEYPRSRIFSYEPGTKSFELLLGNIRMNHLEKRVKAVNAAVASTRGERTFFVAKHDVLGSLYAADGRPRQVKTLTLGDIVTEVGNVDFLKIDAEGAEYEILLNASPTTLGKIKTLSLEYHDDVTKYNHSEILEMLSANGYEAQILLEHENKITGIILASR